VPEALQEEKETDKRKFVEVYIDDIAYQSSTALKGIGRF
jgi:hypothetical protein